MKVSTRHGDIELRDPLPERLRRFRALLPLGAVAYARPVNGGARYGIVMNCGPTEAHAVKRQPPDAPAKHANGIFIANRVLIAMGLKAYLEGGFSGALVLAPYVRHKADRVEAGIAFLPGPNPSGREAIEFPFDDAFDGAFGHGATTMLVQAIRAIQSASGRSGITVQPCIGLDARPRGALGGIEIAWMVHARDIYCLKTVVSGEDPIWATLRSTGISDVFHLPSVPVEIAQDQLPPGQAGGRVMSKAALITPTLFSGQWEVQDTKKGACVAPPKPELWDLTGRPPADDSTRF